MRALFLIASLILAACATEPKPPSLDPIMGRLFERMSELSKNDWMRAYISEPYAEASKAVVRQTAEDVRRFLDVAENRNALLQVKRDYSPLQFAVNFGLTEIVEVLLSYPEARRELENQELATALWSGASIAGFQSTQVCGDMHNNFGVIFFSGYYGTDPDRSPYKDVRRLLEQAGVTPQPEAAQALWLKHCDPVGPKESYGAIEYIPGSRQRVAEAPDTLEAIIVEIKSRMTPRGLPKLEHNKTLCPRYFGACP